MAIQVHISPSPSLYQRDPQATSLGRQILSSGIELLDELGLESCTFKKLAVHAGCTEASIYRYFSSKHQLLTYLVNWYWDWVHYLIRTAAAQHSTPVAQLRAGVAALAKPMVTNPAVTYIDERRLHQVVLREGTKAYHSKSTDEQNRAGVFLPYKELVATLAAMVLGVAPTLPYPRALAATLFEMAHNHVYFAEHLPRLTDLDSRSDLPAQLEEMLAFWVDRLLRLG